MYLTFNIIVDIVFARKKLQSHFLKKVLIKNLLVEEIKSGGGEAWGFVCDVSKPENVYSVAKEVKSTVGVVDILMNNAGVVIGKELLDTR